MKIVWLADAPTFGPMVRAKAVFAHPEVEGTVISSRVDFDGLEALAEVVSTRNLDDVRTALARTEGEVIVSDRQSLRVADEDGRPVMSIGFANRPETLWDLDVAPLHPWGANPPERLRDEIRRSLGDPGGLVLVTMSPRSQPGIIEGAISEGLGRRPDVTHLVVEARDGAPLFCAADLVVTSAGWSSSWEARWCGTPSVLVRTNDSDQWLRESGVDVTEAVEAMESFEGWELPSIPDHVPDFVEALGILVERAQS